MHVNTIINEPAVKIIKRNVTLPPDLNLILEGSYSRAIVHFNCEMSRRLRA